MASVTLCKHSKASKEWTIFVCQGEHGKKIVFAHMVRNKSVLGHEPVLKLLGYLKNINRLNALFLKYWIIKKEF